MHLISPTLALVVFTTLAYGADTTPNWSYKTDAPGLAGPAHWATTHATCGGQRQSPIDIPTTSLSHSKPTVQPLPLRFSGECAQYNLTQHYDAFKAEVDGGSCAVVVHDKTFALAQVHFHTPSEHTIDGRAMDGEAHFVHKAPDGSLVVVGLFLESAACGETDSFATRLIDALANVHDDRPATVSLGSYRSALENSMASGRLVNYAGSLTTPGCAEVVDWWVLLKPLVVSKAELQTLRRQFQRIAASDNGRNARPTQGLYGRTITVF